MAGWIPGLGENRPQPRKLDMSFFGYVPDDGSVDIFTKMGQKSPSKPEQVIHRDDGQSVQETESIAQQSDVASVSDVQDSSVGFSEDRILIRNGKIVNADTMFDGDVYIEDGVIKQVGSDLTIPAGTREIDAQGKYVMPGGVDPHTCFEFEIQGHKSVDDFYTGTNAAVAGGTTTVINFAIPQKDESLIEIYEKYRKLADEKVCCDYGLHIGVTSWSDKVKEEMEELCKAHGVNSFKFFMAYRDLYMLDDGEIFEALHKCKNLGAVPLVHAENGAVIEQKTKRLLSSGMTGPEGHYLSRPEAIEAEAVYRACVIASQVSSPLYLQVTSKSSTAVLKAMRKNGVVVFGEVLASSLGIEDAKKLNNPSCITNPPIRSTEGTGSSLISALAENGLHVVSSGNCTFSTEQKSLGIEDFTKVPPGVNGVEDRMSVVWEKGVHSGAMDPKCFVAITSTNAAKIFNIFPRKGCIAVGSDADVVVWDPAATRVISSKTHHQASDFNIFEGLECHGAAAYVIVNGKLCVEGSTVNTSQGTGKFINTSVNPDYVYGILKQLDETASQNLQPVDRIEDKENVPVTPDDKTTPTTSKHKSVPQAVVSPSIHTTPSMKEQRNLHESTFSISEELDNTTKKSCIRVQSPPGGGSSGGFW
ncbi:dihydropyrimidinase-like isoform X1 [Schistocerca nitens]|uniref:dihydropyrimidinase-like isoform X1 n=1 Tax=Schistocerca nitens TaxID=7011 RepID=UPI0021193612|nr:dihydropyrimidinase-like isoform X1 [Schistocerca nitens]